MLPSCLVDALYLWEYLRGLSDVEKAKAPENRIVEFVCALVEELIPKTNFRANEETGSNGCHLVKLTQSSTQNGDNVGRKYRKRQGCTLRILKKRKERPGSTTAPKTVWKCAIFTPNMHCRDSETSSCLQEHQQMVDEGIL